MAKPSPDATTVASTETSTSTDIVVDTLNKDLNVLTFSELMAMFEDGEVTHIHELDDTVMFDKKDLVNRPMVITSWREGTDTEFGRGFIVVKIATKDMATGKEQHGLFTDGSTGIMEQIKRFTLEQGNRKPIYVPRGLKASEYTYEDPFTKEKSPAVTYYLSNES